MTKKMQEYWTEEIYFTKEEVDKFIKAVASDVILGILDTDDENETTEDKYMQIHGIVKLAKMIFTFTEEDEEEEEEAVMHGKILHIPEDDEEEETTNEHS